MMLKAVFLACSWSLPYKLGREGKREVGKSALSDVSSYQDSNPIVRPPPS